MAKFHVNPNTGEPGPCRAVHQCRFGVSEDKHFNSPEEARADYENKMSEQLMPRAFKVSAFKKMLVIGGVALSTMSISACNQNGGGISAAVQHKAAHAIENKIEEKLNNNLNSNGISDGSSTNNTSNIDSNTITFQGKSLKVSPDEVRKAEQLLSSLTVAAPSHGDSYNRMKQFGPFKSGVIARLEHRDVPNATFSSPSIKSRAKSGVLHDPYTGQDIQISSSNKTDTDADHIDALKEIYVSGAWEWSQEKRVEYANNIDNLALVSYHANRVKGESDTTNYVPSYTPAQCIYVVKQIEIKANYHLSVDSAEKSAMQNIINNRCNY